jgi:hypothetical protein
MAGGQTRREAPEGRNVEGLSNSESTRELFSQLVTEAGAELGQHPSPQATGYVVDLLDTRVRAASLSPADRAADTLAESMVEALLEDGATRWVKLRQLGDRALFDAGFFAARVERTVVGAGYYADVGRTAYTRLSVGLESRPDTVDSSVFGELARHFGDFVTLLAEVGERARGRRSVDLLRLYDRYRAHGKERDRLRLMRHGLIPSLDRSSDRVQ